MVQKKKKNQKGKENPSDMPHAFLCVCAYVCQTGCFQPKKAFFYLKGTDVLGTGGFDDLEEKKKKKEGRVAGLAFPCTSCAFSCAIA